MDDEAIRKSALQWMRQRGWRNKWGKRGTFTQSLFQHTDIELCALLTLLPILKQPAHYGLSDREQQALIVGTIAHDAGKESPAWQEYVQLSEDQQRGRFVPHIIPSLTEEVVPDLVKVLGFDDAVCADAVTFVNLHMSAARSPTSLLAAVTSRSRLPGSSNRWNMLARILEAVDKLCSIHGLLPTCDYLGQQCGRDSGILSSHVSVAYHLTAMRGVSTALLHSAAAEAYGAAGWRPIIYFSNGTVYVADSQAHCRHPTAREIIDRLAETIDGVVPVRCQPSMVVGTPTSAMLPKPEYFDYREMVSYLREAARRVRRGSFLRKPATIRLTKMQDDKGGGYWQLTDRPPAERNLEVDSERIDRAQPLMMVFKFFRDSVKPEVAGKAAGFADPVKRAALEVQRDEMVLKGADPDSAAARCERAIQRLEKEGATNFENLVRQHYDEVFGFGAYDRLKCTSTLMPAREMACIIDPFWALQGSTFGFDEPSLEDVPDVQLESALIELLGTIVQEVYGCLPEENRPTRTSSAAIAESFAEDLIHPAVVLDAAQLARQQRDAYARGKPAAMRSHIVARLCPICNRHFVRGTAAAADFVLKPDSHTNRAVAHGHTGKVVICDGCKYERFLQQLLLGEKVARVLVLTPRMHIGYQAGQTLHDEAHRFYDVAKTLMSNDTRDPNVQVSLTLTGLIAAKLLGENDNVSLLTRSVHEGLDGDTLARLLTYELAKDTRVKRLRDLSAALRADYELEQGKENVEVVNLEWETSFRDWDEAVEAVAVGTVHNAIAEAARARVYRLHPQFGLVCQTPNFILLPLAHDFTAADKESNTASALRELFVLLLVGLALDCSVAAIDTGEPIIFEGGEGVARVPAVSSVRQLIGSEWIGLTAAQGWLEKIAAASLLQRDWDGQDNKPGRSTLYQILTAPTPGHILRRIETKNQRGATSWHGGLITKALQEVPSA